MTRVYIIFLAIATVLVSVTGAYFSVTGLGELFSGAGHSVYFMAGALEFSKFIVVGFLYRYWGHIHKPLRTYMMFAVLALMFITSLGIYGYLMNAYQISSIELHGKLMEVESLEKEGVRVGQQITELKEALATIPATHVSKKLEIQKQYEPRFDELYWRSEQIISDVEKRKHEMLQINTKIGPLVHVAKALNLGIDAAVSLLILLFVLVFDPLAVSLVFCLNLIVRLNEKYRGDEYKIGAHSLHTPVDHRLKKAS